MTEISESEAAELEPEATTATERTVAFWAALAIGISMAVLVLAVLLCVVRSFAIHFKLLLKYSFLIRIPTSLLMPISAFPIFYRSSAAR